MTLLSKFSHGVPAIDSKAWMRTVKTMQTQTAVSGLSILATFIDYQKYQFCTLPAGSGRPWIVQCGAAKTNMICHSIVEF